MSESELYTILLTMSQSGAEVPVAYDHFDSKVAPPFIVYRNDDADTFKADDTTYIRTNRYEINLVTDIKNVTLENRLETILTNNHLPFDKNELFIDGEKIYQITYFI